MRHEQVAQVPCDSPPHRSLVAALAWWACVTAVQIVPVRTVLAGILELRDMRSVPEAGRTEQDGIYEQITMAAAEITGYFVQNNL